MSVLLSEVRAGSYTDSIVLMQLQSDLLRLPGVVDAGVVMASAVNLDLLRANDMLAEETAAAGSDDLVIAVRARTSEAARQALAQVDHLLSQRRRGDRGDFRPRSLSTALRMSAEGGRWVAISTPGRYAGDLARQALENRCHVFLYSDNVEVEQEAELKSIAAEHRRLLLGPDCGSAIVGGVGFGFTNRLRSGPVGLVCASGTGLQSVSSQVHRSGSGISHAIGTGGRDLTAQVGGTTALQSLDLLARDESTRVIVLVSKPPDPAVRSRLLALACSLTKPVVVNFLGSPPPAPKIANLFFSRDLHEAAELAVGLLSEPPAAVAFSRHARAGQAAFLRGLFAGGTLAQEALLGISTFLSPVYSNLAAHGATALSDPTRSRQHTILDLGADEFTVGRLHPMIDQRLRLDRMRQEAADPETALILIDVVLGRGAHPDPAAELAPVIAEIRRAGGPKIAALLVGTDEDAQGLAATGERLEAAGATVVDTIAAALESALAICGKNVADAPPELDLTTLSRPGSVINVGLESLYEEAVEQGVAAIQVNWAPPAGGNEKLAALLEKMKT